MVFWSRNTSFEDPNFFTASCNSIQQLFPIQSCTNRPHNCVSCTVSCCHLRPPVSSSGVASHPRPTAGWQRAAEAPGRGQTGRPQPPIDLRAGRSLEEAPPAGRPSRRHAHNTASAPTPPHPTPPRPTPGPSSGTQPLICRTVPAL